MKMYRKNQPGSYLTTLIWRSRSQRASQWLQLFSSRRSPAQPKGQYKARSLNHFHNPAWHADCPWIRVSRADQRESRSPRGKREHGAQIMVTGFDGFGTGLLPCRG